MAIFNKVNCMELMAPAGNINSFIAAIEGDADSIYLGLKKYNARYPANNFTTFQLLKVVDFAHSKGKKVYLTLNIDFKSNEIEEVSSILAFCEKIKIDAVIVKDVGAILIYNKFFKNKFALHLSTQAGITSSEGVRFAKDFGIKRVILARELTLKEIKKCCEINDIEIEIFCQGSMCFSISGRCLLSSYIGGKSGNRGRCTAPCRVLWEHNGKKMTYFSMKDLSLINNLKEIENCGVKALKIEGRLKKDKWVKEVTSLYRDALVSDKIDLTSIRNNLLRFSAREMDNGHIIKHDGLILESQIWDNFQKEDETNFSEINFKNNFKIIFENLDKETIKYRILIENFTQEFIIRVPSFEKKKAKLQNFTMIKEAIQHNNLVNEDFGIEFINCEEIFVTSSFLKTVTEEIIKNVANFYNRIEKSFYQLDSKIIEWLKPIEKKERNKILGDYPDKIIINYSQIGLIKEFYDITTIVLHINENIDINLLKKIKNKRVIIALPPVLFEKNIVKIKDKVKQLYYEGFKEFEANSFCGMEILKEIDCVKHAGSGLSVYNHIAVKFYKELGYNSVYVPLEGDIPIFKSLSTFSELDIGIIVFGRPELFITRVQSPYFKNKSIFSDKYIKIVCINDGEINRFVSLEPLSFIGDIFKKENIYFDNLIADLRFFDEPALILKEIFNNKFSNIKENSFNYFRKLS